MSKIISFVKILGGILGNQQTGSPVSVEEVSQKITIPRLFEEKRSLRDVSPLGPSMIGINRLWVGGYHEPAVLSRRSTVLAEYRIQHQATSKAQHTVRQMKAETIIRVVAVLIS